VLGTYQIPLAEEKHIETLARVRDEWRAKGWTITDDRTLPDARVRHLLGQRAPRSAV